MDDAPWMPPSLPSDDGVGSERAPLSPPLAAPVLPAPVLPSPVAVAEAAPSPWAQSAEPPVMPVLPSPSAGQTMAPPADLDAPAPADLVPARPIGAPPAAAIAFGGPNAGRSGRSKLLVGSAVVAVLAVGAAGIFAVSRFSGSADGGAADPDALGASLMTAIENEDVLGVIDVLSPGERDLFRQPAIDLVSELMRLEVLSPDADLGNIAGLDIALENETVTPVGTNVDDIVNVTMTADAEVTVDGAVVPVGDLITDNMDAGMVDEMRSTVERSREDFDVELTAVELDGRWYFSLLHTAAEAARNEAAPDSQIPVEGIGAVGAETPEAAMNQVLDAVEGLDLELLLQSLNPGEAAALQRYAPLFLADAEAAIAEVPLEWRITSREFRVDGDGSQRTVFVDAITIEGNFDGDAFSLAVEGDCFSAEFGDESIEQCATDAVASEEFDDILDEIPAVREFYEAAIAAFDDIEPIGLEVREFEGGWYLSPFSTFTEAVLTVLRALDREEIDQLIELGEAAFTETVDMGLGAIDDDFASELGDLEGDAGQGSGEASVTDEPAAEESVAEPVAESVEESVAESVDESVATADASASGDDTYVPADWEECYSETDPAAATACFDGYVASGAIDPMIVPLELRFPECGYADVRWTGAMYSMADAEFIAAVEAARPCFLQLVDAGTISEFDLPSEIANLECFEGRNWYNTFDDPEYDDRYWACIEAAFED